MGYPEGLTAALGGVTVHQLRGWRAGTSPLLVPEENPERPLRYSFRDLIAIRTFAALRTGFSLQKIRRAVANLHRLSDVDHLANYRLVGDGNGDTIVWATGEGSVDILKRPGQRLIITMGDVFGEFIGWNEAPVVPLRSPKPGVAIDPETLLGFPCIENTRIPYDTIADLAHDGLQADDIAYFYPSVGEAGVTGAIALDRYVADYNGVAV
ncbi:DUF433 domain-containing protein [Actinoplanes rectilineatus]|uniref:DUF433 domain-containing protein n=1 Tax=Actinoplanes rectilineatus TaxID=113571 RepID=UPI00069681D2|nr:DUF433 domain-containing protein [Actinoplanes rectilineatus]